MSWHEKAQTVKYGEEYGKDIRMHYTIACDILKTRYGRKERMIFHHIQDLLNLSVSSSGPGSNSKSAISILWKLQDMLLTHIRILEALGVLLEANMASCSRLSFSHVCPKT